MACPAIHPEEVQDRIKPYVQDPQNPPSPDALQPGLRRAKNPAGRYKLNLPTADLGISPLVFAQPLSAELHPPEDLQEVGSHHKADKG